MAFSLREFYTAATAFFARRDNPNEVTAAQVGAYTIAQTDELLALRMPVGILPIYFYGDKDAVTIPTTFAGTSVTITDDQPVMIYGTPFTIESATLSFATYLNTTAYVVVELDAGVPQYAVVATSPQPTSTRFVIGNVVSDATGVTTVNIGAVSGFLAKEAP